MAVKKKGGFTGPGASPPTFHFGQWSEAKLQNREQVGVRCGGSAVAVGKDGLVVGMAVSGRFRELERKIAANAAAAAIWDLANEEPVPSDSFVLSEWR